MGEDVSVSEQQTTTFINRRGSTRIIYENITCDLKTIENDEAVMTGYIKNIGQEGLVAQFNKSLTISQRVYITVNLPQPYGNTKLDGRVIWISMTENSGFLIGINFILLDNQEKLKSLKDFISYNISNARIVDRRKGEKRANDRRESNNFIDQRRRERRIQKPIFLKCVRYNRMKRLMKENIYFYLREIQSRSGNKIIVKGKELRNFGSNNYLGLTNHPLVKEAAIKAIEKYGVGSGGVRVLSGTMDLHNQLEKKLANLKYGEDCIVYSSGYNANVGVISCLISKDEQVIIDEKSHASIIDGCLLSKPNMTIFRHNNMIDLERKLAKIPSNAPKIIMTDGVFSMDGDVAKLDTIYSLGEKYKAATYIDDAHSTGVLGKNGKGTAELFHLEGKIDLTIGTLSKALGGIGGFLVGSKDVIHYLKHNSRSFVFSTSLPPAICASLLKAIEVIETEPIWHQKLWQNINYITKELLNKGYNIGKTESAIIPIIFKNDDLTYLITKELEQEGIFVSPVVYPAVRKNESRIRVSIMASHTDDDLQFFLEKLNKIYDKHKITQ